MKLSLLGTRKQLVGVVLLIVFAIAIGFGVSYTVVNQINQAQQAKALAKLPPGRLPDKNGKAVYEVQLRKGTTKPVDLLLKTGDYVQFNSKDGGEHQIIQGKNTNTEHGSDTSPENNNHTGAAGSTPGKSNFLDSGVFKGDEGYLLQFNNPGKFEFHDNYDHGYTITILVYTPGKDTKII